MPFQLNSNFKLFHLTEKSDVGEARDKLYVWAFPVHVCEGGRLRTWTHLVAHALREMPDRAGRPELPARFDAKEWFI